MLDQQIPDLTFPAVEYDGWSPWDLRPLLYSGGADVSIKLVADLIANGNLGNPITDRFPLVVKLHEEIAGDLQGGGSRATAYNNIWQLRRFFAWADVTGLPMTLASVEDAFVKYADHLLHRVRVEHSLAETAAYSFANRVSKQLGRVLERKTSLLNKTRIRKTGVKKRVLGTQADKQNLEDTFTFGRALLDISDALTLETINGTLPVAIRFRSGQVIDEWCFLAPPEKVKALSDESAKLQHRKRATRSRAAWVADTSHRTRHPLINLRIEAEALIFIAQTGMNRAQVHALKVGKFRYQSHLDGYRVYRVYKGRRHGEVEFEIYSEYRPLFERYLTWRAVTFPGDREDLLFPHALHPARNRSRLAPPDFQAVKSRCKRLGIPFIGPQKLRKTRVNWLLRRSRNPELTAEMDQHTQETLHRVYDQPHHQVAAVEVSRFHARMDPSIAMPGPGVCIEAAPRAVPDAPQRPRHPTA